MKPVGLISASLECYLEQILGRVMKRLLVFSLLALPVAAQQVTIQNPSFETFNTLNQNNSGGPWNTGSVPSWTIAVQGGGYGAGSYQPSTSVLTSGGASGPTAVYVSGATLSQDLGVTAVPSEFYTFTFYVGNRLDGIGKSNSWSVTVNIGTTALCSASGPNSAIPAGTWALRTLVCRTDYSVPSGNLNLVLGNASGGYSVYDNLSFSYHNHQAALAWQDNVNPSGTTYNVYRSNGEAWNPVLLANVSALNYTDTTIVVNQPYIYKVTAIVGGVESDGQFIIATLGVQ